MLMPSTTPSGRGVAALLSMLAGFLAASCGSTKDSTSIHLGPPASLTIIAGDAQSGVVGQELPQPVVVKVVDANGNPVPVKQSISASPVAVAASSPGPSSPIKAESRRSAGH